MLDQGDRPAIRAALYRPEFRDCGGGSGGSRTSSAEPSHWQRQSCSWSTFDQIDPQGRPHQRQTLSPNRERSAAGMEKSDDIPIRYGKPLLKI